jgi:hypothetical protein
MEPSQTARLSCSASFKAPGGSKMTKDLSDQGRLRYPKPHRRLERFFWSLVSGLWSLVSGLCSPRGGWTCQGGTGKAGILLAVRSRSTVDCRRVLHKPMPLPVHHHDHRLTQNWLGCRMRGDFASPPGSPVPGLDGQPRSLVPGGGTPGSTCDLLRLGVPIPT